MNTVLTIVIIAVAMWFLSNLFRGGEDERANNQPKQAPRRTPAGRNKPDIDRFLEEINRRRLAAERESARPTPQPPPQPAPVARQRPRPARPESPRRAPVPAVLPAESARAEAAAQSMASAIAAAAEEVKAAAKEAAPAVSAANKPAERRPATTSKPVPPAVAQLQALLRSPQSLQTAWLLQEVLGPPRSKRR